MDKSEIQKRLKDALTVSPSRKNIYRVSLFGSYLHGTAKSSSDIDLLIEFNEPISMFKLVQMERELSTLFGKKVDLCTPKSLSRYFRPNVIKEAEPIYQSAT